MVRFIIGGKRVGDAVYLHEALLAEQPPEVCRVITEAVRIVALPSLTFNVVRISLRRPEVALLDYPDFFREPFPVLRRSWLTDLDTTRVSMSDFSMQGNPPILELLSAWPDESRQFVG
jgi:hypothetical protein